jgi:hypothetical protein
MKKINNRASDGHFSVYVSDLSEDLQERLKNLGFDLQYDETEETWMIVW